MKYSILLPTRNRLDLLLLAIESVREQNYADWEILVSDNASDSDIAAEVSKLGEPRIRTRRFGHLVPVTDNWNAALEMAVGDYCIMLGDDDVLVPGGLAKAGALIEAWDAPEAIYAQAHQYAYPDVVPGHAKPFVQTGYNAFLEGKDKPFRLAPGIAQQLAFAAMDFRILYGFNMQHFVFSRRLVRRLEAKGPFFQSPYPDYYAANAVLLSAASLVATPEPVCMIGISPKSFGFYYVNSKESDGMAFLNNVADSDTAARLREQIVPGTNMNDSWLCAMEILKRNFPETGAQVTYARYRRLQYHAILHSGDPRRHKTLLRAMRWWEIAIFGAIFPVYFLARLLPRGLSSRVRDAISHALFSRSPRFDPRVEEVPYRDILEAARAHAR
ncbi:MAG: glycosyltransferase [Betaproteobacteria bacterium]|nr:glycosyltransferase [Betaproteobacteria bacterium]